MPYPLISARITAPAGLTKAGNPRKFRDSSLKNLQEAMQITTTRRTALLRQAILATYVTRSTGATASSIRATPTRIVKNGVEVGISGYSEAFRFLTKWGGLGKLLPPMWIYPKTRDAGGRFKRGRLRFIGRGGELVVVRKVYHPGFVRKGDVIDTQMQEYIAEVRRNVLETVSRATMQWASTLDDGPQVPINFRRQYRASGVKY